MYMYMSLPVILCCQVLIPKLKEPDLNPNVVINIVASIGELAQVRGWGWGLGSEILGWEGGEPNTWLGGWGAKYLVGRVGSQIPGWEGGEPNTWLGGWGAKYLVGRVGSQILGWEGGEPNTWLGGWGAKYSVGSAWTEKNSFTCRCKGSQ